MLSSAAGKSKAKNEKRKKSDELKGSAELGDSFVGFVPMRDITFTLHMCFKIKHCLVQLDANVFVCFSFLLNPAFKGCCL